MKPKTRDGILRGNVAVLIRFLLLVAAGVSGYLLSVSLAGGNAVGCGPGSSCDEVLNSRWAYVFGVPVSVLALLVDLTLLVTTFSCGANAKPKQRRRAWEILVPGSVLVLGAALWFVAIQAVVLQRFCPWCMAAHTSGALAAVLLLMRIPMSNATERRDNDPSIRRPLVVRLAMVAILMLALFAVAQVLAPRKTFSVSTVPEVASDTNVVMRGPDSPTNVNSPSGRPVSTSLLTKAAEPAKANPALDLFGGRVRLDLSQIPIWGSPNAPLKMVSLFDYTCHHCRDMHSKVVEVHRMFGDQLAIVSLPMPLDAQCNSLIRRTSPSQTNACLYAKIGLAVWRAKPSAIEPFDDWLFGFQKPPPLVDATNKAVELVGSSAFQAASVDPLIDQLLRTSIELFTISARDFRNGSMPQFMIGTNIVTGVLTTEQLRAVVLPYAEALRGK